MEDFLFMINTILEHGFGNEYSFCKIYKLYEGELTDEVRLNINKVCKKHMQLKVDEMKLKLGTFRPDISKVREKNLWIYTILLAQEKYPEAINVDFDIKKLADINVDDIFSYAVASKCNNLTDLERVEIVYLKVKKLTN